MKAIQRIFLFCLMLVVVGIIVMVLTAGYMVSLGPPAQRREVARQSQPIETPSWSSSTSMGEDEVTMPPLSLDVRLDLLEGAFQVLPGTPGEGIRIEADYDAGIYALEKVYQPGEGEFGIERVMIRFYSKYSMLRRLLTLGRQFEPDNQVKIYLPPDIPIHLSGAIRMAESELDLSGLPLTGLELDLAMGEHEVRIDEPNPIGMDKLRIDASKGEFTARGLGNAGFQSATVHGSMGELSLDLRGEYARDASVRASFRMGELNITVPEDVHVDVTSSVTLGGRRSSWKKGQDIPDNAPFLSLQTTMSLGELNIRSQ